MNLGNQKNIGLSCLLAIALTGCQTVEQSMQSFTSSLSNIQMPSFSLASNQDKEALQEQADNCPEITIINELGAVHQLTTPVAMRTENKISSIKINSVDKGCHINENNVVINMDINFEGRIGPKAKIQGITTPSFTYPYFIAITTPASDILAKEVFSVTMSYNQGQQFAKFTDSVRQIIPVGGDMLQSGYQIMIGFQLTDAELAYNRSLLSATAPVRQAHYNNGYIAEQMDAVKFDSTMETAYPVAPVQEEQSITVTRFKVKNTTLPVRKPTNIVVTEDPVTDEDTAAEDTPPQADIVTIEPASAIQVAPDLAEIPYEAIIEPQPIAVTEEAAPKTVTIDVAPNTEPVIIEDDPKTLDDLMESLTAQPIDLSTDITNTKTQADSAPIDITEPIMAPPPMTAEPEQDIFNQIDLEAPFPAIKIIYKGKSI